MFRQSKQHGWLPYRIYTYNSYVSMTPSIAQNVDSVIRLRGFYALMRWFFRRGNRVFWKKVSFKCFCFFPRVYASSFATYRVMSSVHCKWWSKEGNKHFFKQTIKYNRYSNREQTYKEKHGTGFNETYVPRDEILLSTSSNGNACISQS